MSLRVVSALLVVSLGSLVGCAAEDRPPAASLSAELAQDDGITTEIDAQEPAPAPAAETTAEAPKPVCEPGAQRDCRVYSTSESGNVNCYASIQFCRSDGRGFHKCADFEAAAKDRVR